VPWLQQTLDIMLPLLPAAEPDHRPRSNIEPPAPLFRMENVQLDGAFDKLRLYNNGTDASVPPQSAPPRKGDQETGHELKLLKPEDWAWAKLVDNTRVTSSDWWQDVRQIELDLENEALNAYPAGSICSLQPRMSAKEVDDFLKLNELTSEADKVFCLHSAGPGGLISLS
jgi:sulfite reductase alpha subunit-like flavoprotein